MTSRILKTALLGGACGLMLANPAWAKQFDIPSGDLKVALDAYAKQAGVPLIVASDAVKGSHTRGVEADVSAEVALSRILAGTGFVAQRDTGAVVITDAGAKQRSEAMPSYQLSQVTPIRVAAAAATGIESVVVTSSKIKGDIQTVPIAITALSQEQLTSRQIAGGPDLVKEVPNLTFSKTNFTGYNIQIRGIGTQAISVTTDPAVAVAFNDTPFIRNHFFEQEFYDVNQVEVLRGPQGTLYGRNATAGVVNVISAKPTDQFEAMASADIGNYHNRRYEGMINIPIVDDRLDLRVAGEWTKRDGYSFNSLTNAPIDGRDLWSARATLGWKPVEDMQVYLVWEHFGESDDRMRTAKQLCKTAPIPTNVDGVDPTASRVGTYQAPGDFLSQGCELTSLYSAGAFGVPNGYSVPYYFPLAAIGAPTREFFDVYASTTQSSNLRDIESTINPIYKAKNDTVELNADYQITPALTLSSQTGYNQDFLWSTEDYNRFNSAPGAFTDDPNASPVEKVLELTTPDPNGPVIGSVPSGIFCDPQLGCSDRLVAQDMSDERAWQLSQEFRLATNFTGPLNFSVGGNYLHYETEENYYVFINSLTLYSAHSAKRPSSGAQPPPWVPRVTDNSYCLEGGLRLPNPSLEKSVEEPAGCVYVDPNPLTNLNNQGHNYFLSQNPYVLNSYAGFGETYYNVAPDLKLTGGIRWTEDKKHFLDIPSELIAFGYGYPVTGQVDQQWDQLTGRAAANWTPKLDFTDQTLVYGSYSHGYKAGGANPPGAVLLIQLAGQGEIANPIHPLTFKPEFIDAYELGTKNTLEDGGITLNGDVFFYNYKGYQISEIVDRTSINLNFDATVKGAELEASYQPIPGLKFNFAGGYEDTRVNDGQSAVDLMDRTAGNPGWIVVRPWVSQASNCILPKYVVAANIIEQNYFPDICSQAYANHVDPVTDYHFVPYPAADNGSLTVPAGYPGFDPLAGTSGDPYTGQNLDPYTGVDVGPATNNGEGFNKNVGGNQLPNAPHFTVSLSGEYTLPVSADWAATLHSDFYWQSQSFARVFNDRPYDKIRGYSTTNVALILTSASGWQVMGYLKNVFNVTAITGTFLNSDDSDLTTNVFLTDPRLFGVRVTKNW
jgi:iron complex outermembrane recepter protein